jgi:hypothetical protein
VAFNLKEIIAAQLGENYELHEKHVNRKPPNQSMKPTAGRCAAMMKDEL